MIGYVAVSVAPCLLVIAWLCFRLSKVHGDLADSYTLVANMLRARDLKAAELIAERFAQTKKKRSR